MCCFILTLFPDKQQGKKLLHKQDSTKPAPIRIHAAIPKMSSSWLKVVGLGVCKLAEFFLVPSKLHSCWGLASSLLLTAVSEALGELWLHAALSRCHDGSANAPPISRLACPRGDEGTSRGGPDLHVLDKNRNATTQQSTMERKLEQSHHHGHSTTRQGTYPQLWHLPW